LLALLATPTIADKTWVSRQYDHQLFLNTVVGPGGDAAVLRLKGTRKAIAIATDGKARFALLDPRTGGRLAVLEAARNVACVGASPLALVNCLNFGNPEHPEVMWQFAEVVEGMSEACEALGIPVIGGNVSFYNEHGGTDIHPTPVAGVLGLVDPLDGVPPGTALPAGDVIVVLGTTGAELGGSEWAAVVHGATGGRPPEADLIAARRLHELVAALVAERAVTGVHDCADGGLAVTLAEMAFAADTGFRVDLAGAPGARDLTPAEAAFSESTSRVVVTVARDNVDAVLTRATAARVPAGVIGEAGGDRLVAAGAFDVPLADAARAWRDAIPAAVAP
jgi:phosphoribosylformylglycinamidine synthase